MLSALIVWPDGDCQGAERLKFRAGGDRQRFRLNSNRARGGGVMSRTPHHPWTPPLTRRDLLSDYSRPNPLRRQYESTSYRDMSQPLGLISADPPNRRSFQAGEQEPAEIEGLQPIPQRRILRPIPLRPLPEPTPGTPSGDSPTTVPQ